MPRIGFLLSYVSFGLSTPRSKSSLHAFVRRVSKMRSGCALLQVGRYSAGGDGYQKLSD